MTRLQIVLMNTSELGPPGRMLVSPLSADVPIAQTSVIWIDMGAKRRTTVYGFRTEHSLHQRDAITVLICTRGVYPGMYVSAYMGVDAVSVQVELVHDRAADDVSVHDERIITGTVGLDAWTASAYPGGPHAYASSNDVDVFVEAAQRAFTELS